MQGKQAVASTIVFYSIFAFPLAFLGLPLYIHLPKFIHDHFGVSLASIGLILLVSRLLDAIVDPLLGILSDRYGFTAKKFLIVFGMGLVISFNSYFYLPKGASEWVVLSWFTLSTFFVYGFFSLLYVNFYSLGLAIGSSDFLKAKLSSFRESSAFFGMITASILPAVLVHFLSNEIIAFRVFGLCFGAFMAVALWLLPGHKPKKTDKKVNLNLFLNALKYIFQNVQMRQLIIVFFVNSLPVAITSNLFSFYVEQTLKAKASVPLFLLCYLLTAAVSAGCCSMFFKSTKALLGMMAISAIGFSCTYFIDHENSNLFYGICLLTGIGVGGELVIFPVIAAQVLQNHNNFGSTFFGIWASCTKISLAVAAGIFLPLISKSDQYFRGIPTDTKIAFFYAIIPLFIKGISIYFVFQFIINQQKEQLHAKI